MLNSSILNLDRKCSNLKENIFLTGLNDGILTVIKY